MSKIKKQVLFTADMDHNKNLEILKPIYDSMAKCYGPHGGNTILSNGQIGRVTKDGVSILHNMGFEDIEPFNIFLNMIKKAAGRNDMKCGDGTTTTTLLIVELYKACVKAGIAIPPNIIEVIEETINDEKYVPEHWETLIDIASVALNNNSEHADVFRGIFSELEKQGVDWRGVDIFPLREDSIKEDKITYSVSTGLRVASEPIFGKIKHMADTKFRMITVPHRIETADSIRRVIELAIVWANIHENKYGDQALLIAVPSMTESAKSTIHDMLLQVEQQIQVSQGKDAAIKVDIIEMIHPLFRKDADASLELSKALCSPVIKLLGINEMTANGLGEGIPNNESINTSVRLREYFLGHFAQTPQIELKYEVNRTHITTVEATPQLKQIRDNFQKQLEDKISKLPLVEVNMISDYKSRLSNFKQTNIILSISASTSDSLDMLFDMFQDACHHVNYSKSGIIGGANLGMLSVLNRAKEKASVKDNSKDMNMIQIIIDAYGSLVSTLYSNREFIDKLYGHDIVTFDYDVISNALTEKEKPCKFGIDLTKKDPSLSEHIISSSDNEINILKSAIETVNMWMTTNQLSFKDRFSLSDYINEDIVYA